MKGDKEFLGTLRGFDDYVSKWQMQVLLCLMWISALPLCSWSIGGGAN